MQGEFVSLRPIRGRDDYDLIALWSASDAGSYSSGSQVFMTGEAMEAFVAKHGLNYLMVVDRDGEPVGGVSWQQLAYPGSFEVGNVVGSSELWGLGYGVESVNLLLEFLFHQRNAHRIHLMTGLFNKQMVQIFLTGPIKTEGVLRDFFFLDGEYHDALVGSLLRDEYYAFLESLGTNPVDLVDRQDKLDARAMLNQRIPEIPACRPDDRSGGDRNESPTA
ncbi:GNAT family N-acetyltransferase [Streptomyces prasinopilosus]|uniref:GNAT family N-acetyltransferase n=1 Tax=Streptomyces prasinopilosus TaxID=67344 RepID=UPI00099E5B4A|nr:GNAT family protein [Streptomyces prasinopilosus]